MFLIFALAFIALVFTFVLAQWLLARDQGPADMRQIATYIREGAEGFLKTQYSTIARYAAMVAGLLFLLYLLGPNSGGATGVSSASMAVIIAGTFSTGAFMSGVAGYVGRGISVRATVRTAAAPRVSALCTIATSWALGCVVRFGPRERHSGGSHSGPAPR